MPLELLNIPLMLPGFVLVLARTSALTMATPMFANNNVPIRVRGALALVLAMMLFPLVRARLPGTLSWSVALGGLFGEAALGLLMGLTIQMLFVGMSLAGLLIGQQAGLALGQIYNPDLENTESVLSRLYFYLGMMFFLAVGGHRALVRSLLDSFGQVPPGGFAVTPDALELVAGSLASAFVMAVRLAGPTLVALFLATLSMGFVSRTVPQLNILAVGFSIRIVVGLVVSAAAMVTVQEVFLEGLADSLLGLGAVLGL